MRHKQKKTNQVINFDISKGNSLSKKKSRKDSEQARNKYKQSIFRRKIGFISDKISALLKPFQQISFKVGMGGLIKDTTENGKPTFIHSFVYNTWISQILLLAFIISILATICSCYNKLGETIVSNISSQQKDDEFLTIDLINADQFPISFLFQEYYRGENNQGQWTQNDIDSFCEYFNDEKYPNDELQLFITNITTHAEKIYNLQCTYVFDNVKKPGWARLSFTGESQKIQLYKDFSQIVNFRLRLHESTSISKNGFFLLIIDVNDGNQTAKLNEGKYDFMAMFNFTISNQPKEKNKFFKIDLEGHKYIYNSKIDPEKNNYLEKLSLLFSLKESQTIKESIVPSFSGDIITYIDLSYEQNQINWFLDLQKFTIQSETYYFASSDFFASLGGSYSLISLVFVVIPSIFVPQKYFQMITNSIWQKERSKYENNYKDLGLEDSLFQLFVKHYLQRVSHEGIYNLFNRVEENSKKIKKLNQGITQKFIKTLLGNSFENDTNEKQITEQLDETQKQGKNNQFQNISLQEQNYKNENTLSEIKAVKKEVNTLKLENTNLRNEIKNNKMKTNKEIQNLQTQLNKKNNEIKSNKLEMNQMNKEILELNKKNNEIKTIQNDFKNKIEDLNGQIEMIMKKIN